MKEVIIVLIVTMIGLQHEKKLKPLVPNVVVVTLKKQRNLMWALELENTGYYLPKTPYTVEEMKNGYITNKPERIGRYVHKKYVENIKRDLELKNWNVVFIEKQLTV